jgi:hypothetical protein
LDEPNGRALHAGEILRGAHARSQACEQSLTRDGAPDAARLVPRVRCDATAIDDR